MPFDAWLSLLCVKNTKILVNGRIDRIFQPGREKVVLSVFILSRRSLAAFSVHPRFYRSHPIEEAGFPQEPPACMLIRKYLQEEVFSKPAALRTDSISKLKITTLKKA